MKGFWDMTRWLDGLFSAEFKGAFMFLTITLVGIRIWLALRGEPEPEGHVLATDNPPRPKAEDTLEMTPKEFLQLEELPIGQAVKLAREDGQDADPKPIFREAFEHWPVPTKSELQRKIDDGSYRNLEGTVWWIETEWLPFTADCYVHYYENFFGRSFDEWHGQTIFMWRISPEGKLQTLDLMEIHPRCSPEDHTGQDWVSFCLTDEESEFSTKVDSKSEWSETPLAFGEYRGRPTLLSAAGKAYAFYSVTAGRDD